MRHPIVLALSLAVLAGCGDGVGDGFPGRFERPAPALVDTGAQDDTDAAPADGGTDPGVETPDGIGIFGGRSFPPRRAFPSEYNDALAAVDDANQGTDLTADDRLNDSGALDGQDTTGGTQNPGEATYSGSYIAEVYTNIDNPLQIQVERASSDVTLSIDLSTGRASGRSADNRLEIGRAARLVTNNRFEGAVRYDGVVGIFDGTLTTESANADFAGEDPSTAYIGRFESERVATP